MRVALWLHLLGTVIWVGGMFFAHVALRPAVLPLPPPVRLPLMAATMATFFRWVGGGRRHDHRHWLHDDRLDGGFANFGAHIHAMTALGIVMTSVFGYIVAVPYPRMRAALAGGALPAAGEALTQVRRLVGLNLIVGLATITVAVLGHGVL